MSFAAGSHHAAAMTQLLNRSADVHVCEAGSPSRCLGSEEGTAVKGVNEPVASASQLLSGRGAGKV